MTERKKIEARLAVARVNGGAAAVMPRNNSRYTVEGRSGARYTVHAFTTERMECDCKAGMFGNACWHAAAVYLRIVADRTVTA